MDSSRSNHASGLAQAFLSKKQSTTPAEFAAYVKSFGEVFWWEQGPFWVVTDYALAQGVMRNQDFSADRSPFFLSRMPDMDLRLIKDFFEVIKRMMVMSDADIHLRRRRTAAIGFGENLLKSYQTLITETVDDLIVKASAKGHIEFVRDIAQHLPSIILADLFKINDKDRSDFYRWSHNMTQFFGGASRYQNEDGREVNRSASSMREFFRELMDRRRMDPQQDFLSVLIQNQARFGLDDDEVVSQAIMMLVAGQITTTDQMCNNMFSLLEDLAHRDALVARPELMEPGIEECNRMDPAVTFLFRVAKSETSIGSQKIPQSAVVFIANHAVNRDPSFFENPDRLQLDRQKNIHFAYGQGAHFCLGSKLAKMQMMTLFGSMFRQFPNLRLDPDRLPRRKHHSLAFSGFERMDLLI